jgi:predicted DNA-binding transcriptional regulator AlpA
LDRVIAAQYIGVSVSMFDQMVSDGRMPGPKRIGTRKVWDRAAVDKAFAALPEEGATENEWDAVSWQN